MLLTLSGEVWSLRERLAAWEALAMQQALLPQDAVDSYEFTAEQEARLAVQRRDFVAGLFSALGAPSRMQRTRRRQRAAKRARRRH
jgi:hypothetical protein